MLTVQKCFLKFTWNFHEELVYALFAPSLQVFIGINKISPRAFISPGCTVPAVSVFPHRKDAPVPSSAPWPFGELSLVCP